ncbi:MAG: winged helix-turn-helix domain-containing protein [Thermoplasmatota archaeon]
MDEEAIGLDAGKVWKSLHEAHSLTKHQLLMRTQLAEHQLDAAIGWLARENKIKKDGAFYCLDETNLTETVGTKAGQLFTVIQNVTHDASVLKNLTTFTQEELHQAIGWLAKEGNMVPSENNHLPDLIDAKETIHLLHHQIQSLHEDISKRNHIIHDLTHQLTQKQMDFMKRADVIEQLNDHLAHHQQKPSVDADIIQEAQRNIVLLTEEIETLHHEISSRNQIIEHLSNQLTEKQTAFIQQTEVLDRLQHSLCKQATESPTSVTTDVQQRIQDISFLQKCLEQKQDQHITDHLQNSTLVDQNTPTIRIDSNEHQGLNDELNNVLHHRKPDSIFERSTQNMAVHGKKTVKNDQHRC